MLIRINFTFIQKHQFIYRFACSNKFSGLLAIDEALSQK
jgi:hypothetical protein